MAQPFLVLNHRSGWSNAQELANWGLTNGGGVRSIVYNRGEFREAVHQLEGTVEVCGLILSETEGVGNDYSGLDEVLTEVCSTWPELGIGYLEFENEPDLKGIPPEVLARLINVWAPVCFASGLQFILPSVAGPDWQGYLARLWSLLDDAVKPLVWANMHPYGQRVNGFPSAERLLAHPGGDVPTAQVLGHVALVPAPGRRGRRGERQRIVRWGFGEMDQALLTASDICDGIYCVGTESGIKVGDAGGLEGQRTYVEEWFGVLRRADPRLRWVAYFARNDQIGGPSERGEAAFGLIAENGVLRPAGAKFQELMGASGPLPLGAGPQPLPPGGASFGQGFLAWASLEPWLIGYPTPLDPAEYGAAEGFSQQLTADAEGRPKGLLSWAHLYTGEKVLTFYNLQDRSRHRWHEGDPASELVR